MTCQFSRMENTRYSTLLSRSYSFYLGSFWYISFWLKHFWYISLLLSVASLSLSEKLSWLSLWIVGYFLGVLYHNDSTKASSVLSRVVISCFPFLSCRRCGLILHSTCCHSRCTRSHTQYCSSSNRLSLPMCKQNSLHVDGTSLSWHQISVERTWLKLHSFR